MNRLDPLRPPPVIATERLVVRMANTDDVHEIIRYFTDNEAHLAHSRPRPGPDYLTPAFWEAQVHAALAEFRTDRSLRLFVFEKASPKRVIGNVNFTSINRGAAQFCYLGYGLDREKEGRGMMREALEGAIAYAFREMHLHRIMANYVPWNQRSGGLLRRLGFVVEGYARDYLFLNGRWEDHIMTSLINPDWQEE